MIRRDRPQGKGVYALMHLSAVWNQVLVVLNLHKVRAVVDRARARVVNMFPETGESCVSRSLLVLINSHPFVSFIRLLLSDSPILVRVFVVLFVAVTRSFLISFQSYGVHATNPHAVSYRISSSQYN